MPLSTEQRSLLDAIRFQREMSVETLLRWEWVNPNFGASGAAGEIPLHLAVETGNLAIVKMLVEERAKVNTLAADGTTALDVAEKKGRTDIATYLHTQGAKRAYEIQVAIPPAAGPVFTPENLPEKFDPEKWVGRTREMRELWKEVPAPLKRKFNFSAALSEARRATLRGTLPPKPPLSRRPPFNP